MSIYQNNCQVKGLYLTGHWIPQIVPGSVAMAAFSGRKAAKLLLTKLN